VKSITISDDLFEALERFLLDSFDVSEVFAAVAIFASVSAVVSAVRNSRPKPKNPLIRGTSRLCFATSSLVAPSP
jgi:hypothetical protein